MIFLFIVAGISSNAQTLDIPPFGTDSTFEAVTWNIEWFPKNGQTTVDYVAEIITDLEVDLLALQEIDDKTYFDQLLENLEGWDGYYVNSQYSNLAYIYNTEVIDAIDFYEIYTTEEYWRPFPRAPMVFELMFMNIKYVVINNHLKCCGDGYMDTDDPWDEETRRRDAMVLLEEFIRMDLQDENVILLGDLNDNLADPPANNVFNVFIDNEEDYLFVDMEIAKGSNYSWSYPSWPSHLDHILITEVLFDVFSEYGSEIQTLRLDDFFGGGFNEYDNNVSDHRPVGMKLKTESSLAINQVNNPETSFSNYPNPFQDKTTFRFGSLKGKSELEIVDTKGNIIRSYPLDHHQESLTVETENIIGGIYFARLKSGHQVMAIQKLVILK